MFLYKQSTKNECDRYNKIQPKHSLANPANTMNQKRKYAVDKNKKRQAGGVISLYNWCKDFNMIEKESI